MKEIVEAQKSDTKLKHLFKRNAVLDKGLVLQLVENKSCMCNEGRLVIPKPLQQRATMWCHHYLQHPGHTSFNSLTPIWVRKSSGGNKKLLGWNKKLPLCRFSTVGIVRKVPSTQTQLPPQTSSPWWCRLPLLRRSICGSAQSDTGNLFRRSWPRAVTLDLTYIVKITM